jgi:hypothetical protein
LFSIADFASGIAVAEVSFTKSEALEASYDCAITTTHVYVLRSSLSNENFDCVAAVTAYEKEDLREESSGSPISIERPKSNPSG